MNMLWSQLGFDVRNVGMVQSRPNTLFSKGFGLKPDLTGPTSNEVIEKLQAASDSLISAFRTFKRQTTPVYSASVITRAPVAAGLRGLSARMLPVIGGHATLNATQKINTQTSTDRVSSGPLGLQLTSAASRLSSAATLGLDTTSPETASTLASAALGLDITSPQSASTLVSTAEMNSGSTTSYGSGTLNFTGPGQSSTSTGTLSGVYTGVGNAADATSLVVRINKTSTLNVLLPVNVEFQVEDQAGNVLFTFDGGLRAGQSVYLGDDIGLSISFSGGRITVDHTDSTTVSHTPIEVDPEAAFNNANPNLRPKFQDGAQVTAGSFTINGTSIAVNANDTINSVIARINSSAAGVTASLAGDKITLTTNSYSEDDVILGSDTSGFLSAAKLAGAVTSRGNVRDDQQALSKTTQFSGVASGSFAIAGVSISIDTATDSIASIVERINSSAAGVTAALDQGRLILTTSGNSEDEIALESDTTGFLAAAGLASENTARGNIHDNHQVLSQTAQFSGVSSGSFTLNGETIAVDVSADTLETVISRINGANAGVTAAYDAAQDRIVLTSTSDSEALIQVDDDTTGLLAAAQLSSANTVRGNIRDDEQALADTAAFGGVTTGSFTLNGVTISIGSEDTLQSVIARINAANAGATASYNGATDKISFTPDVPGSTLSIEGDTSGFLAAAGIVQGSVGAAVNPDAAFNGTGLDSPLFDPGLSVQAGSFTVNGVTIEVGAEDTVNTVLTRITASEAGVIAAFDGATQTVRLTSAGQSVEAVTVGDDTSGFLAAVKLDETAESTPGAESVSPFDAALDSMTEYSGVRAGIVTLNGQEIAIEPGSTTLRSLVAAMNSIEGLTATLDESSGRVALSADRPGMTISLSDTSGLLSAIGIDARTYTGTPGTTRIVETRTGSLNSSNAVEVAASLAKASAGVNEAIGMLAGTRGTQSASYKDAVAAVRQAVEELSEAGIRGLSFGDSVFSDRLNVQRDELAKTIEGATRGFEGLGKTVERLLEELHSKTALATTPSAERPLQKLSLLASGMPRAGSFSPLAYAPMPEPTLILRA